MEQGAWSDSDDGVLEAVGPEGRWKRSRHLSGPNPVEHGGTPCLCLGDEPRAIDGQGRRLWRPAVGTRGGNGSSPVVVGDRLPTAMADSITVVELDT